VVVVPVAHDDNANRVSGIDPEVVEIPQRYRSPGSCFDTGVDHEPLAAAEMDNDTLTDARPKERHFKLVGRGRITQAISQKGVSVEQRRRGFVPYLAD
jgi:hypothetical protein